MALIKTVRGKSPNIDPSCWLADNATITGDVHMGQSCSVWFQAVIRGDVNTIKIGDRVNIQDHSMIHGTYGRNNTIIGDDVSIGHRALIHGCQIQDKVLVGMGAIIMDDAILETGCMVAAGAVVLENAVLEGGFIYAGIPAKKIKPLNQEQIEWYIKGTADRYIKYASWYEEE